MRTKNPHKRPLPSTSSSFSGQDSSDSSLLTPPQKRPQREKITLSRFRPSVAHDPPTRPRTKGVVFREATENPPRPLLTLMQGKGKEAQESVSRPSSTP